MKARAFAMASGLLAIGLLATQSATGAALETVRLDGAGGAFTNLNDAILSVDDGGVIEITQAGDYGIAPPNNVTLMGSKSYTIRATVPGVTSSHGWVADPSGGTLAGATEGNVNVTLEDIEIDRSGTGAALFIEQYKGPSGPGFTNSVTLVDCLLQSAAGEGMRIDGVGDDGGQVTLTATGTIFSSLGGSSKAGLRVSISAGGVPSGAGGVDGLIVNLTDCTISSAGDRGVRNDGGLAQTWTLDNVDISAPTNRGFTDESNSDGSTYTFRDCSIVAGQEAIHSDNKSTDNTWNFHRTKIDSSSGTFADRTIVIRETDAGDPGTSVNLFNCLILAQDDLDAMESTLINFTAYHCTVVGGGTLGEGFDVNTNTGLVFDVKNSIFSGFAEGIASSSSVSNVSDYNIFDGNQTVVGVNSLTNTALNLDAGYAPQPGSPAIEFGSTDSGIATAVENVDINGDARPAPAATNPDAGAFEVISAGILSAPTWRLYAR